MRWSCMYVLRYMPHALIGIVHGTATAELVTDSNTVQA